MATMQSDWQSVGSVDLASLGPARVQLHSAVQLVAIVGKALADPVPDFSHTSLEWDSQRTAFVGVKIRQPAMQASLEVPTLTFSISPSGSDPKEADSKRLKLHGRTLADAVDWLRITVEKLGAKPERLAMLGNRAELPLGILADAGRFDATHGAEFLEWSKYYGNASALLNELAAKQPGASAVRVWPHHFDIAFLITLKPEKTIGVGLSPGDASYNEPYWYVTPSPYPDATKLPPLDGGASWHTQEWVGAVLPFSRIPRNLCAEQERQVRRFIQSVIEILRG